MIIPTDEELAKLPGARPLHPLVIGLVGCAILLTIAILVTPRTAYECNRPVPVRVAEKQDPRGEPMDGNQPHEYCVHRVYRYNLKVTSGENLVPTEFCGLAVAPVKAMREDIETREAKEYAACKAHIVSPLEAQLNTIKGWFGF